MQPIPAPLRFITATLSFLRIAALVAGTAGIVLVLSGTQTAFPFRNANLKFRALKVALSPNDYQISTHEASGASQGFILREAFGNVELSGAAWDELRPAYRRGTLPAFVAATVMVFWLLTLARRLCGNVIAGHAFSEDSILLLHKLGLGLVLGVVLISVTETWFYYETWGPTDAVIRTQVANVSLQAPGPTPPVSVNFFRRTDTGELLYFRLDPIDFLAGVVVLALGEIFRQGRKLQRDAELTI